MDRINPITNSSKFPIGYHKFHKKQLFNFQLNRWYSLGYARFEDLANAGKIIHSFDDWKSEMINLAEAAGHAIDYMKTMNAFFYWLHMRIYKKHKDFMARLTEKNFYALRKTFQAG